MEKCSSAQILVKKGKLPFSRAFLSIFEKEELTWENTEEKASWEKNCLLILVILDVQLPL